VIGTTFIYLFRGTNFSGFEGSYVLPARPSGRGTFEIG
jgi:hypothetical protein